MTRIDSHAPASRRGSRYFGKYRGKVLNNVDPKNIGRLLVEIPDVEALFPSSWALPCLPAGGMQNGMFAVPPLGAGVWIEFEQGDPDYPIWIGSFWGSAAEVPNFAKSVPPAIQSITLQTPTQNGMLITDMPGPTGGIQLKTRTQARISITDLGIELDNALGASIKMIGPQVNINNGALTII